MSGPSTPNGTPAPKQMSSRLMTMKFMQRAVAARTSGSQTPASEPPSKKRRVEPNSGASTPSRMSESDSKHMPHLHGAAQSSVGHVYTREGGETEWVLNVRTPRATETTRTNGHAQENGEDDDIWSSAPTGRQTYGSFRKKKDQSTKTIRTDEDEGELSSGSGSSDSEDDYQNRKPAAKAGPGPPRYPSSNSYGSPLTKMPNSKERRKQSRSQHKKKARKTM